MISAYSTLGLPDLPLVDQFELIAAHGYEGAEIALTPSQIEAAGDAEFWRKVKSSAAEAGVAITCLHLGNPRLYDDPSAPRYLHPDATVRRHHVQLARAACEIAGRLGCTRVAVASGAQPEGLAGEAAWELLLAGLGALYDAVPAGCELLVEHEPEHFISTVERILELARRTDGRVLCNFDVGHSEVAGEDIPEVIGRLGTSIIRNVHFEDIKDRKHKHLLPGEGEIDFAACGAALRAIGYEGPVTADLYPYASAPLPALERGIKTYRDTFRGAV